MKLFYPLGCAMKRRAHISAALSLALLSSIQALNPFPFMDEFYTQSHAPRDINSYASDKVKIYKIGNNYRVEYTLDNECQEKFRALMAEFPHDPYIEWPIYTEKASEALRLAFPPDLLELITRMRERNEPACILVHGMPVDESIPATPENGARPHNKGYISEASLMGVCGLLGAEPDYDEREKDGTYINQIIPVDNPKNKAEASSLGSETEFQVHTENVYNEPPLKFFALLGLRGDPKVCTGIIFLDDILEGLKRNVPEGMTFDEMLAEIQKPQFRMQSGPSFGDNSRASIVAPILTTNSKGERLYRFNANPDRVVGINERAQYIVDHLTGLLCDAQFKAEVTTRINLKKGDLLLFNNWEVMHGRDAFKIDKSNWRWLQRVYMLVRD